MPLKHSFYFRILDFILVLAISQGIPNNNNRMENGFMLAAGSVKSRIYVIDLVSGNIIRTFATKTATGVIVDEQRQVAYIAQFFERNIFRFCLQRCQDNEKIINTGDGQPEHVVVDFSTGNVYFSAITIQGSRESSFIGVIHPDKLFQRRIITGLNQPRAMALYPSKGIMFWSDYGDNIIERISMDGTNRRVIIRNANSVGLAIDYMVDTLYYGDFGRCEISIANFDGIKIRTIVRDSEIEDVLVNGPHVYYTRLNRRPAIVKVLKESGRVVPFLNNATDTGRVQSLDVVPRDPQPVNERCADRNGLCSGLCLPTPEGRTCACQDGVDLLEDGITCEGDIRCPTSIPNGNLDMTCTSFPGETCNFTCNKTFTRLPVPNITCLDSGDWNQDISTLCVNIRCPTSIPNGNLDMTCTSFPGETCNFTCNKTFTRLPVPNITCLDSGDWNQDILALCVELPNSRNSVDTNVIILSVVICITALVIISLIVIAACCVIKNKRSEKSEQNGITTTKEVTLNYLTLNDGYQTPAELRYDKLQNEKRYVNTPDQEETDIDENYYSVVR